MAFLRLENSVVLDIARRQLNFLTHRIHSLPIVLLMPHSRCNCRCVMCDIWRANEHKQEISRGALEKHLDVFRKFKVRQVVFSGGEALMHSNLWTFCESLKELQTKITLLSTGLLLQAHAHEVIHWCDEVIVSLDGSREIHNKIRNIPRAYERLAEGVKALKLINSSFRVSARCVIQRANFSDLPNIVEAAHEIDVDEISFLAVDVSSTAFNRPTPWGKERIAQVALNPKEIAEFQQVLEDTISEYAADFRDGFIAESPHKLRRLPRYFAALHGDRDFPEIFCNAPWVSTVVEADGTVRPCFFHRSLGNIHDKPLNEILNSNQAINFRRSLDVKTNPICQKCTCSLNLKATRLV